MLEQPRLEVTLPQAQQEQLYELFVQLALNAVNEVDKVKTKPYLNQKELMALFHCGSDVIKGWINQGLPYFEKGNSKMFRMVDVDAFIQEKLLN